MTTIITKSNKTKNPKKDNFKLTSSMVAILVRNGTFNSSVLLTREA